MRLGIARLTAGSNAASLDAEVNSEILILLLGLQTAFSDSEGV